MICLHWWLHPPSRHPSWGPGSCLGSAIPPTQPGLSVCAEVIPRAVHICPPLPGPPLMYRILFLKHELYSAPFSTATLSLCYGLRSWLLNLDTSPLCSPPASLGLGFPQQPCLVLHWPQRLHFSSPVPLLEPRRTSMFCTTDLFLPFTTLPPPTTPTGSFPCICSTLLSCGDHRLYSLTTRTCPGSC